MLLLFPPSALFGDHPDGDVVKVPCIHPTTISQSESITIPGFDKGMKFPGGSTSVPIPGFTIDVKDLAGNKIGSASWGGSSVPINLPDVGGRVTFDPIIIPFTLSLPGFQHPQGDDGPTIPCIHPFHTDAFDAARYVIFHTGDSFVQDETKKAIDRLAALMARPSFATSPARPLHVFNRPMLPNHPQDSSNPFWSHYEAGTHAINIHYDATADRKNFLDALHHELGHAIVGQKCVQITTPGGGHGLDNPVDPALAMSEGWADFVALAIRSNQNQIPTGYLGQLSWEGRRTNPTVPLGPNIESNVARTLWDLYDTGKLVPGPAGSFLSVPDDETASIAFKELYKVFSPTLATLDNGPLIPSVNDYVARLKENNPTQAVQIEQARVMHCG